VFSWLTGFYGLPLIDGMQSPYQTADICVLFTRSFMPLAGMAGTSPFNHLLVCYHYRVVVLIDVERGTHLLSEGQLAQLIGQCTMWTLAASTYAKAFYCKSGQTSGK
jgi:hypothetical protein